MYDGLLNHGKVGVVYPTGHWRKEAEPRMKRGDKMVIEVSHERAGKIRSRKEVWTCEDVKPVGESWYGGSYKAKMVRVVCEGR